MRDGLCDFTDSQFAKIINILTDVNNWNLLCGLYHLGQVCNNTKARFYLQDSLIIDAEQS